MLSDNHTQRLFQAAQLLGSDQNPWKLRIDRKRGHSTPEWRQTQTITICTIGVNGAQKLQLPQGSRDVLEMNW